MYCSVYARWLIEGSCTGSTGVYVKSGDVDIHDAKITSTYTGTYTPPTGTGSGTQGQGKRLEAINIKLDNQKLKGDIEYSTHVQSYGWQSFVKNNALSGTSGKAKRLEAIKIRLTDELAENYDIYYRVHAQKFGWLGWAKNGEPAGTEGYGYRLEGIEIKLVEKDGNAPGSTENSVKKKVSDKTPPSFQ